MDEFVVIIQVDSINGEEGISINKLSDLDLQILEPMILDIQSHRGHYLKGRPRRKSYEPTARELYRHHAGWDIFESILPSPKSGFTTVYHIHIFKDEPLKIEML